MSDGEGSREYLERMADQARVKLLHTVDELDRRRHDAFDLRLQLKRHLGRLALSGVVFLVITAGAVAMAVHRIGTAAQRRRRDRWRLAKDVWTHPDRAIRARRGPIFEEVLRSLLLALLNAAVTLSARHAVTLVLRSGSTNSNPSG